MPCAVQITTPSHCNLPEAQLRKPGVLARVKLPPRDWPQQRRCDQWLAGRYGNVFINGTNYRIQRVRLRWRPSR